MFKRLRCKPLKQDKRSREADEEHLDDQVYRLHILRAMAKCVKSQDLFDSSFTFRPCYIMACYCTVGEQAQGGLGRQATRLTTRQDSSLSFASISNFGWKKESTLNLASTAAKHSLIDPGHKSFRPEADCQLHYECNDPISRYFRQPNIPLLLRCFALKTLAEDLASQTPEYR